MARTRDNRRGIDLNSRNDNQRRSLSFQRYGLLFSTPIDVAARVYDAYSEAFR